MKKMDLPRLKAEIEERLRDRLSRSTTIVELEVNGDDAGHLRRSTASCRDIEVVRQQLLDDDKVRLTLRCSHGMATRLIETYSAVVVT